MEHQSELTSFVGVYVTALQREGYKPSEIRYLVTANLVNEILNIVTDENDQVDSYGIKPLLSAANNYLKQELIRESADAYIPQVAQDMSTLKSITEYLDSRMNRIKKP